jgi:hypothetical protein
MYHLVPPPTKEAWPLATTLHHETAGVAIEAI